jgi:hypothetical protein
MAQGSAQWPGWFLSVGIVTVRQLEGGVHKPRHATLQVIRQALEKAGVDSIDESGGGVGVRLRKPG